jgi:hypothetical protein
VTGSEARGEDATVAQRYCTNCGVELREGQRFCGECGTPVEGQAANDASPDPSRVRVSPTEVPPWGAPPTYVPPPHLQAEAIPQQPQAPEQATPIPQPRQRSPWGWRYAKGPIYLFLGTVIVTSVLDAAVTQGGMVSEVGFAIGAFSACFSPTYRSG